MNEKKVIEIVLKDEKTVFLYKKRNELFDNLKTGYDARKEFCRTSIIIFNMERMHFSSLIDRLDRVKELNSEQLNGKYSKEREENIVTKMVELQEPDWSSSEKATLKEYYGTLDKLSNTFSNIMKKVYNIKKELHEHEGKQIVTKVEVDVEPYKTETEKLCRHS